MTITDKFIQILTHQNKTPEQVRKAFNPPMTLEAIAEIERKLGESIPDEIKELYALGDGFAEDENYKTEVTFFGGELRNSKGILVDLNFSHSCVKSEKSTIPNPDKAKQILNNIAKIAMVTVDSHLKNGQDWQKITLQCSHESTGDVSIEIAENQFDCELSDDDFDNVTDLCETLHELEKNHYNWHKLNFCIYSNGTESPDLMNYQVEREFSDYASQFGITAIPTGVVKPLYYHYKWLPVFGDGGGNFVGVDLDPDTQGIKGQVITFGSSFGEVQVLAESMESLFDKALRFLDSLGNDDSIDYGEINIINFLLNVLD